MFIEQPLTLQNGTLNIAENKTEGTNILFLHGVTRGWRDFAPLVPLLHDRYHLALLDQRGHGNSQHFDSYLVEDYIKDAVQCIQQTGQRVIVYGHSLGAMVALGAAAEVPRQVQGVILEDPPFDTLGSRLIGSVFEAQFKGMKEALLSDWQSISSLSKKIAAIELPTADGLIPMGRLRDSVSIRFSAHYLAQTDPKVLEPLIAGQWLKGFDWKEKSKQVHCPMLLLQGDLSKGAMLTDEDASFLEQSAPECHRIKFPNVGHLIHWMDLANLQRHLLGFVESLA